MYWDTLGPRWPLYADMGDSNSVSSQSVATRYQRLQWCCEVSGVVGGEFRGSGVSRVEEQWVFDPARLPHFSK
jgi:hypothetical protein